jgi:hypothetical protein
MPPTFIIDSPILVVAYISSSQYPLGRKKPQKIAFAKLLVVDQYYQGNDHGN